VPRYEIVAIPELSVTPEACCVFGPVTVSTTGNATSGNPDASIAAIVKVWVSPTGLPNTVIGVIASDPEGGTPVRAKPCVIVSDTSPPQHSV